MPRRPRFCPAGLPVQFIQRGDNRQILLAYDSDLAAYWNQQCARLLGVEMIGT